MIEKNADYHVGLSPTEGSQMPKSNMILPDILLTYEKCIACSDYGSNCKGPKLAALHTIANVREYHRRLRKSRNISMKEIYALTEHVVSNATIKEYFAHEDKDFRWTTVSLIDNAMTTICGQSAGVHLDDVPHCPATSTEIREREETRIRQAAEAESRCATLLSELAEEKDKQIFLIDEVRREERSKVEYLKSLSDQRLAMINRKDKVIAIMGIALSVLMIAMVAMALFM